ncbi:MAG TPA: hypothetical protein VLG47_05510 [Candidatus Saccharimonadales bacterium]|nr:hypothetical protein [Candidatus Saccharimonadales bacterium]
MLKVGPIAVSLSALFFASFSQSSSYQLNSYSVGPGGSNSSSSSTYSLQGSTGEQANGSTTGTNDTTGNGSIQTEQLNTPLAPSIDNGSNAYYNKLHFVVNNTGEPSDATYAVAITTDATFATNIKYIQADGTLNTTKVYQSYATWGSGTGTFAVGMTPNVTYYVKSSAMQGKFTDTGLSKTANNATTANPSITFAVSPNTLTMSNLLPGSVISSSNISFNLDTNGANGGGVYVSGSNNGMFSTRDNFTIPAFSGNLTTQSQGFGVQATSPGQTSGGPFSTVSPFNGSSNVVGAETTTPQSMLTSRSAIVGGNATANVQAKASSTTPASSDYSETLTFIAAANF